ncbi:ATP phosphoribosyltransferase [Marinomonas mediterranea]|uniref:ATP phosphoribosyltransferase n=1 Tax=Marinomonas mediterranea (strain ATCC 700492 / JCM 21426 / NBRC 103028 / MMB-1) TaxID=717774 RepID=F2JYM9_MARM1|nr:ATP phosphoribosyltransferase [Marinomonas mediterranea]ADZ93158.1 ATP phosphoribosyltransferase [Marinomonas mediterranea MMB-1]WCN15121.1 ATP phosphoribosyltransferase [Marinomonas mediterranea]WCN19164.1 ATP phosphoribosyltransferase [Marinomonas mediterranea MMB-1]
MIRMALPNKGSLYQPCIDLLVSCGYSVKKPTKGLYFYDEKNEIEFYFLRANDIPMYLSKGIIDIGITGKDFHSEKKSNAVNLLDLPFGHSKLCIAAMQSSTLNNKDDISGLRVATSFPNIVGDYFQDNDIEIVELDGAVEISVSLGLADCVVDIVETGSTLKSAGLRVVSEPIFTSNASLYSAPNPTNKPDQNKIVNRITGRLIALDYQLVEYDSPLEILDQACELTPGLESPTICQLKDQNWCSVKSMIKKNEAHQILDSLQELGCKAILLTNIEMARI